MNTLRDELIQRVLRVVAQDPDRAYSHYAGKVDISATPDIVYVYAEVRPGVHRPVIVFGRTDLAVIDASHREVLYEALQILRQHQILDDVAGV